MVTHRYCSSFCHINLNEINIIGTVLQELATNILVECTAVLNNETAETNEDSR